MVSDPAAEPSVQPDVGHDLAKASAFAKVDEWKYHVCATGF